MFCVSSFSSLFCHVIKNTYAHEPELQELDIGGDESLTETNISIFIRKPTYSVFYNDKLYFIDEDDNLLKIYNSITHNFESVYLSLAELNIIDVCFANGELYVLVKNNETSVIKKIDLTEMKFDEEFNIELEMVYETFSAEKIKFDDKNYTFITLSKRGCDAKIALIPEEDGNNEVFDICFNSEDSTQTSIKKDLKKTLSYQSSNGVLYIIFIYNFSIAYCSVSSFDDLLVLKQPDINIQVVSVMDIPKDDTVSSFNDLHIIDVSIAEIDSVSYIAISYNEIEKNEELIKLYSFNLGGVIGTIVFSTQFPSLNSKYMIFSGDTYSYVDRINQKLYFTKISKVSDEVGFRSENTEIKNPNYSVNYLQEDNFVYKYASISTKLYENPWGASSDVYIEKDTDVIKIGSAVLENNTLIADYDYCLFTTNNYNYTGFVKNSDLLLKTEITPTEAGYKERVSIWPKTTLYSLPTTITSGQIGTSNSFLVSKVLMNIEDNSEICVLDVLCGYTANNTKMLKVKVNGETIGYIEAKCVRFPASVVDFVITNATIKKDGTTVYLSPSSTASTLTFKLNSGKNVRINGKRDTKSGWTSITFNDEYGNEFSGYIETDYLKADSWSALQIVGCILIAINIGLLILILIFKHNHLGNRGQKLSEDEKITQ